MGSCSLAVVNQFGNVWWSSSPYGVDPAGRWNGELHPRCDTPGWIQSVRRSDGGLQRRWGSRPGGGEQLRERPTLQQLPRHGVDPAGRWDGELLPRSDFPNYSWSQSAFRCGGRLQRRWISRPGRSQLQRQHRHDPEGRWSGELRSRSPMSHKTPTVGVQKHKSLQYLRGVHTINLSGCNQITDKGLQYLNDPMFLSDNLKGVHTINLSGCYHITDKGLQYLKGVHTINLSGCYQITDQGLQYLKGVHTINLKGCNQITDQGLQYLKEVHTIGLYNCSWLTDRGLQYLGDTTFLIGGKLKGVHNINLTRCNQITDQGLQYLKGVHNINLTRCNQITDQGLQYLKGVYFIDLTHCDQITDQGLQYLAVPVIPSSKLKRVHVIITG